MAGIAREVGLSEAGLLHYFPTKRHLLAAVAERRFTRAQENAGFPPRTDDGLMALRMLLALVKSFATQPGMIELFVLTISDIVDAGAPARSMYVYRYDATLSFLTSQLERDRERGLIRAETDPQMVARQCVGMLDGLQVQWLLSDGEIDLVSLMRDYLEQVSAALSPTGVRATLE